MENYSLETLPPRVDLSTLPKRSELPKGKKVPRDIDVDSADFRRVYWRCAGLVRERALKLGKRTGKWQIAKCGNLRKRAEPDAPCSSCGDATKVPPYVERCCQCGGNVPQAEPQPTAPSNGKPHDGQAAKVLALIAAGRDTYDALARSLGLPKPHREHLWPDVVNPLVAAGRIRYKRVRGRPDRLYVVQASEAAPCQTTA